MMVMSCPLISIWSDKWFKLKLIIYCFDFEWNADSTVEIFPIESKLEIEWFHYATHWVCIEFDWVCSSVDCEFSFEVALFVFSFHWEPSSESFSLKPSSKHHSILLSLSKSLSLSLSLSLSIQTIDWLT